jgi:hypothetical protein
MELRTGERAELLTGRPVEGGMRLRSPEVAMGRGGGDGGAVCGWSSSGDCGGDGSGGLHGGDLLALLFLVGDAEFVLHLHAELV